MNIRNPQVFATIFLASLATYTLGRVGSAQAADSWPGLRGPSYDGAVHDASLFAGGAGELKVVWERQLGSGYSVVTADAGRLVTAFQDGDSDVVALFDPESGDERWRYRIGEAYRGHTGSHDGPIATPVLDGDRVYGLGPRGHLFALDAATGQPVWTRSLVEDLGAEAPYYGFASSPLIASGVLVVGLGAGEGKAIGGFDARSGELLWSAGTDTIRYHSPVLTTLGGRLQVVAAGNRSVLGIDPASGRELWSYEHAGDQADTGGNTIVPVLAGEGRILLLHRRGSSVMLQIARSKDRQASAYQVTELWSSPSIKATYLVPVYHDGYLYGMNGRIFTCVDAATGEIRWRSREPGDGSSTLVGDLLLIQTKAGALAVVEASPKGYHELTRLALFEDNSWSAPAFAGGHIYLRSMGQLARVDPAAFEPPVSQPAASQSAAPKPLTGAGGRWIDGTRFGRFLARVAAAEGSGAKTAVVDAYLAEQRSFPIVEDSGAVHFVYRGEAQDVGIVGDMIGARREDPMSRVAGTDLFTYSTRLEPDAAVSYGFIPDYGDPIPDPRNPRTGRGVFGEVSWFAMPAWAAPDFLDQAGPAPRGNLETVEWQSRVFGGRTRKAEVYLPAAYDADFETRYPVVYLFAAEESADPLAVRSVLDHRSGDTVRPLLAVSLLSDRQTDRGPGAREKLAELLATELVPLIDETYRTVAEPMARAVAGAGGAADSALATAFLRPETFGRVGGLWPILFQGPEEVPAADEHPLVVFHLWGRYHLRAPHEGWDDVVSNRQLWESLREAGHHPTGGEVPEGFGIEIWRAHTVEMLAALFPMPRPPS